MDEGSLLKMCAFHGITGIYESRAEVWKQFAGGKFSLLAERPKHVWAIGISLSADFELGNLLEEFILQRPKNLRILLLDALTSTAVFRDCLESSGADALDAITKNKRRYFAHNVYRQFENALDLLMAHDRYKEFKNSVRFYRHTPLCWMVRADDVLFFQPYTFGSSRQNEEARTIGSEMPIFRIDRKHSERMFRILVDHGNKLWSTSEGSVHATSIRNECKDSILKSIFALRGDWLRSVCYALYKTEMAGGMRQDRRTEARSMGTSMCGRFSYAYKGETVEAEIADYTHDSLALWVRDGLCPRDNETITTKYLPGPPRDGVANDVAQHYIQQFDGKNLVVKVAHAAKNDGSDHASDRRLVLALS
jgi:hypothetical protein